MRSSKLGETSTRRSVCPPAGSSSATLPATRCRQSSRPMYRDVLWRSRGRAHPVRVARGNQHTPISVGVKRSISCVLCVPAETHAGRGANARPNGRCFVADTESRAWKLSGCVEYVVGSIIWPRARTRIGAASSWAGTERYRSFCAKRNHLPCLRVFCWGDGADNFVCFAI